MGSGFADGDRVVLCELDITVKFDGFDYSLYVKPHTLRLVIPAAVRAVEPEHATIVTVRLFGACAQLGPRALEVLTAVAERLAKGAREHGDFTNLERDWDRESLEEQLDDLVYRTVKQLRSCGRLR